MPLLRYGRFRSRAALHLKNIVRVLRAERAWTRGELAERLNVSQQTVSALEVGKYDPSLQLAFKIAELFERSVHDIFLNDGNVPFNTTKK
jgi:putative transcriptional regulator